MSEKLQLYFWLLKAPARDACWRIQHAVVYRKRGVDIELCYIIIMDIVCFRLIISLIISGNCQRRMLTCRSTWRRRVMRKSGWVVQTRSCCGVFRRASWARTCHPTIHHSIDLLQARAHHPTLTPFLDEPHYHFLPFRPLCLFINSILTVPSFIRCTYKQTLKVLSVVG